MQSQTYIHTYANEASMQRIFEQSALIVDSDSKIPIIKNMRKNVARQDAMKPKATSVLI